MRQVALTLMHLQGRTVHEDTISLLSDQEVVDLLDTRSEAPVAAAAARPEETLVAAAAAVARPEEPLVAAAAPRPEEAPAAAADAPPEDWQPEDVVDYGDAASDEEQDGHVAAASASAGGRDASASGVATDDKILNLEDLGKGFIREENGNCILLPGMDRLKSWMWLIKQREQMLQMNDARRDAILEGSVI